MSSFSEITPLRKASTFEELEMVREILVQNSEQAVEIDDSQRSTPLHRAAAKGNLDVVRNLLAVNPDMCFHYDLYGRTPLQVAAIRGQVEVFKEMARVRPQAALEKMENGDTVLHLCARYNNGEALKALMEVFLHLVNSQNDDGNTILHLAAIQKNNESFEYLVHVDPSVDTTIRNRKGLTALDIVRAQKETHNDYAFAGDEVHHLSISETHTTLQKKKMKKKKQKNGGGEVTNWVQRKRDSLMVVASLLATMAFQSGVNPPGGFWQDDGVSNSTQYSYFAGESILASLYPDFYAKFLVANTIGFIASLSIILLFVSGLPIRYQLFMWLLMIIMWIDISAMTLAYFFAISGIASDDSAFQVLFVASYAWLGWMSLLVIAHAIRLSFRAIKRIVKTITKRMRKKKEFREDSTISA